MTKHYAEQRASVLKNLDGLKYDVDARKNFARLARASPSPLWVPMPPTLRI